MPYMGSGGEKYLQGQFFSSVTFYKGLLEEGVCCVVTLQVKHRTWYFPPDLKECVEVWWKGRSET